MKIPQNGKKPERTRHFFPRFRLANFMHQHHHHHRFESGPSNGKAGLVTIIPWGSGREGGDCLVRQQHGMPSSQLQGI